MDDHDLTVADAAVPRRDEAPDWIRDAARGAREEVRLYLRTLWGISARPSRFARAWADGTERGLNPLAFMATTASLFTGVTQLVGWLGFEFSSGGSFGRDLLQAVGPFVQYAAAGLLAHLALFAMRSRRRWRDSLAIGLYAGGPAFVGYLLTVLASALLWVALGRPPAQALYAVMPERVRPALWALMVSSFVLFARSLCLGLAGVHNGRRVAAGLATLFALSVLALVLGRFEVHGPLGLQYVLFHTPRGWRFDVHD